MNRFTKSFGFIAVLSFAACDGTSNQGAESSRRASLDVATASQTITDAVFECSTRLLNAEVADNAVNRGDPILREFLDKQLSRSERSAASPRHDSVDIPALINDADVNPCLTTTTIAGPAHMLSYPQPGFCRAAFNYCLGNELAMKAHSFAHVPSEGRERSSLHELARDRFQRAATEYLVSLGYYTSACGTNPSGQSRASTNSTSIASNTPQMCSKLMASAGVNRFTTNVHAQLADAILQAQTLLREEVALLMAHADSLSTYGATGVGVGEAIWGLEPGDPTTDAVLGSRMEAASRIMGDADSMYGTFSGSQTAGSPRHVAVDVVPVGRSSLSSSAELARSLLSDYRVPVGIFVTTSGTNAGEHSFSSNRLDPSEVRKVFNLLDHRIAADEGRTVHDTSGGTYDYYLGGASLRSRATLTPAEFDAFGTRTIRGDESPLTTRFGLEPSDVRDALVLIRDQLMSMSVEHAFVDQVPGPTSTQLGVRLGRVQQRSPLLLAAALAEDALPSATGLHRVKAADVAAPFLLPTAFGEADSLQKTAIDVTDADCSTLGYPWSAPQYGVSIRDDRCDAKNWYDWDYSRMGRLGASGVLHVVRVYLRRLRYQEASASSVTSFIDTTRLDTLLSLVEPSVGEGWYEYTPYGPRTAQSTASGQVVSCTPGSFASCMSSSTSCGECDQFVADRGSWYSSSNHSAISYRWTAYLDPNNLGDWSLPGATVVVGRDERAVRCLHSGDRGGGVEGYCEGVLDDLRTYSVSSSTAPRVGRVTRSIQITGPTQLFPGLTNHFIAPSSASFAAKKSPHLFIFLRTGTSAADYRYRLVDVVNTANRAWNVESPEVHPFGGEFLGLFTNVLSRRPENPVLPLHNSLGLTNEEIPPLENELIDNGDGVENSYLVHLDRAARAAETAGQAVEEARNAELELIRDARADEATVAQAADEELTTSTLLCGAASVATKCAVPRTASVGLRELGILGPYDPTHPSEPTPSDPGGYPAAPFVSCETFLNNFVAPPPGTLPDSGVSGFQLPSEKSEWDEYTEGFLSAGLTCARWLVHSKLEGVVLRDLPTAVVEGMKAGGSADYAELEGELRRAHIDLHERLLVLKSSLESFESEARLTRQQIPIVGAEIERLTDDTNRPWRCRRKRAMVAIGTIAAAAASIAASVFTGGATAAMVVGIAAAAAAGGSSLISQVMSAASDSCDRSDDARRVAANALADYSAHVDRMLQHLDDGGRAARIVALADVSLDAIETNARAAQARYAAQVGIAQSGMLADLPEWRALTAFRASRAWREIRRAQMLSIAAKRSIELRLGVDMSTMITGEPFVPPPATWVNDIYVAHVAVAREGGVGVAVPDHAILGYIDFLHDFIDGYPYSHRLVNGADEETLNLQYLSVNNDEPEDALPFYERLAYVCRDAGHPITWLEATTTFGSVNEPCSASGGVQEAHLSFSMDSRLTGYIGERLARGNFNYRHGAVALNFVGGALLDCSRSDFPIQCYQTMNVRYSLRLGGATEIENYDGVSMPFWLEPARTDLARGLAAGRVITNPMSSVDRSLIAPYRRDEFMGRPLAGVYELSIEGGPEIVWSELVDVQVLLDYRYWTRLR